jgi:uncharacterized protein YdhG (YjbR/CyaY superfamily)
MDAPRVRTRGAARKTRAQVRGETHETHERSVDITSVDQYIASQPKSAQRVLTRVRNIIRKAVPEGDEVISYKIPTYKLHGKPVLYFAGWSEHYSLYPSSTRLVAAFREELAPYQVSKGTIRFPFGGTIPAKLIEGIARFRAREVANEQAAKAAGLKKR